MREHAGERQAPLVDGVHTCERKLESCVINGVRIDAIDQDAFLRQIDDYLRCRQPHVVHFLAAHPLVLARHHPAYRDILNRGDLNVADGQAVAWACRIWGRSTARIAGSDGFALIASWGIGGRVSHYLFGGEPTVVEQLGQRLSAVWPAIELSGTESPPFRPLTNDEIGGYARTSRRAGTKAMWVGLGAPKQDVVAERLRALSAAPIILCVGAAFDFLAGTKVRAPMWMQRAGLEWAHRLGSEPGRLWRRYLLGNPQFLVAVLADRIASFGGGSPRQTRPKPSFDSNRPPAQGLLTQGLAQERRG